MSLGELAKKVVAAGLPALGGILGGPAGAAGAKAIADRLGVKNDPDAIAAVLDKDPTAVAALTDGQVEIVQKALALRETEIKEESKRDAERHSTARSAIRESGETARVEAVSKDRFVSRARPMIHYAVAFGYLVKLGLIAVVIWRTGVDLGGLASIFDELTWEALAITGVGAYYVGGRSKEKRVALGEQPGRGIGGIVQNVLGGRR